MISFPIARPAIPFGMSNPLLSLNAAAVVTALADWLLYRHPPGISVVIFLVGLCAAALLTNPIRANRTELVAAAAALVAALLPAIEHFSILSLAFAGAGAAVFVLLATGWPARPAVQRLGDLAWMIISGPFRLAADAGSVVRKARERDVTKHGANWLLAWIVPVGLGAIFLILFSQANPLIENWFISFDASGWRNLDFVRPLFWLVVVALIWPFLRVQLHSKPTMQDLLTLLDVPLQPAPAATPAAVSTEPAAPAGPLFGKAAILRSLVLFNALFAVQSVLDVAYLWGGVALPAGMSYASYAHRGAYPLIVTALLAGAFVLAAMQPATAIERSRPIRTLVFLWIGQNVLLVLSSMLRLDLYVDVYSLTGWRCAAFVWMLLVAAGLLLIVARIALDRPNSWLVWSNAAVLVLTLYGCSLVDFSGLIASFNVNHSREISGTGEPLDVAYLCGLGPAALPAIDALAAKANVDGRPAPGDLLGCRSHLAMILRRRVNDWRAWTFRRYRLLRYLDDKSTRTAAGADRPAG